MPRARAIPILAGAIIAAAPGLCGGQLIETTPVRPGAAESGPLPDSPDARRPEAARRIVRTFDFETHDPVVPELPALWFRAQHDPPTTSAPASRWTTSPGSISRRLPRKAPARSACRPAGEAWVCAWIPRQRRR